MFKKFLIIALALLVISGCAMAASNLWRDGSATIVGGGKSEAEVVSVQCPSCSRKYEDVTDDIICECDWLLYVCADEVWYCNNCDSEWDPGDAEMPNRECVTCNFWNKYCDQHECWYEDICIDCEEDGDEISYGEQFEEGYMAKGQSSEIWQAINDGIEEGDGSEYEDYFEYEVKITFCDCGETIYYYYNPFSNDEVDCGCGSTLYAFDGGGV